MIPRRIDRDRDVLLRHSPGFTMIEIVIMLSILTFISAILLTSVPGFNEDASIIRAQQELALNFRRIQNIAFAVAQITLPDGTRLSPSRIGLHFDTANPKEYFYFIDADADNIYSDPPRDTSFPDQKINPPFSFQHGVRFNPDGAFYDQAGGAQSVVNVIFSAPEAKIAIYNDFADIGGSGCFELKTPNLDLRKAVRIRVSGQVALEDHCNEP